MKYKRRIVKRETFKQVATLAKLRLPRRISTFAESGQKKSESNGIITELGKKKKDE